jgi:glycosyltransferase involved in cell wall biosynthesis
MLAHASVLLVHPTGNQSVAHAALELHRAGALAGFHTTIAWWADSLLGRLLPAAVDSELSRRRYPGIPRDLIHTHPWRETARLLAERGGWRLLTRPETGPFCFDAVCASLDRAVARSLAKESSAAAHSAAVYAYDDCALQAFHAARQRAIRRIYELPIDHYRAYNRIVAEERKLRPEWASTLPGLHNSVAKLARKDDELLQADSIMVGSSFTAKTLETFSVPLPAKIFSVPLGAPPLGPPRLPTQLQNPLRVLFVGILSQRKGIGYLIEATARLKIPFTLTLAGRPIARPPAMESALARHLWIPTAPHGEVLKLMREHDVLVFPSLFEGFGLVILEAMAQGTVVIATPNTAAPDLFADGEGGFIVPIRSPDAIADRLTQLAEDRDLLARMSEQARSVAARFTWELYGERLLAAIAAGF